MNVSSDKERCKILVAVDCIIFGFDGAQLKALLVKRRFKPEKGKWSLIGGFLHKDEDADDAATRVLQELTGMSDIYMEQLSTFSDVSRDAAQRVVTIAYFALINVADCKESLEAQHEAKWFPLSEIPPMIFDHRSMLLKAKEQLRLKVAYDPIGFELLPEKFTLPQLQSLFEAIYEAPIDRRNFTKKMRSLGVLRKLAEKEKQSSKKGAFYYILDSQKYRAVQVDRLKLI